MLAPLKATFWQTVLTWTGPRTVWTSRAAAKEWAGFLEIAHRLGTGSYEVIDVTDAGLICHPGDQPDATYAAAAVGQLQPEAFVRAEVWASRAALGPDERAACDALWRGLRAENAPLRVVEGGWLVSAPLTHFDALLAEQADEGWRKAAFVVGSAMARAAGNGHYVGDALLSARLDALIEAGMLDGRGAWRAWADGEVRLPSAAGSFGADEV